MTYPHNKKPYDTQCPTYRAWSGMKARVLQSSRGASGYYARGISVCDRWAQSYACFLLDMGERPSPLHTLDRIDNDGNYEPGNCRWATRSEQQRNRRTTAFLEHNGQRLSVSDWADQIGISPRVIWERLSRGYSTADALSPYRAVKIRKLTRTEVDEIRERYKRRVVTQKDLAREYGVSRGLVAEILCGSCWNEPTDLRDK